MSTADELAHKALDALQEALLNSRIGTAVVYLDCGDEQPWTITDEQYWANPNTIAVFEDRAARHARRLGSTRFAFAVDAVIAETDAGVWMRPPNLSIPMEEHETEVMYVVVCDLEQGVEVGRVEVLRDTDTIAFGPLQILEGQIQFEAPAPGFALIKAVAA